MDRTFLIVLMSVLAVAGGVWDLVKRGARDLLGSFLLLGLGMVAGVGLESIFGGGFLVGAVGGFALGMPRLVRAETKRKNAMTAALLEAPDTASSLLVVHDRLDELESGRPSGGFGRTGWLLGLAIVALVGFGEVAIGLAYNVWQFLLAGSCVLFLPLSQIGRMMVEAEESQVLRAALTRLHASGGHAADALPPGASDEARSEALPPGGSDEAPAGSTVDGPDAG